MTAVRCVRWVLTGCLFFGDAKRPGPELRVHNRLAFMGSHCYVVSRRGARRLLSRALPLELALDWYLSVCMNAGVVDAFAVVDRLVFTCLAKTERNNFTDASGVKRFLPDLSMWTVVLMATVLLVVLVTGVKVLVARKKGRA